MMTHKIGKQRKIRRWFSLCLPSNQPSRNSIDNAILRVYWESTQKLILGC